MKLQLQHQTYLNKLSLIKGKEGYAKEIEAYIDEVLYDKGQAERQCREIKVQRDIVLDQLSLTDYEEIKHQLNLCLTRLSKLSFEIEKSVEESTSLRKDLEQLKQEQEKKKEDYDRQGRIVEFFQKNKVYLHEYFPTIHTVFDGYFGIIFWTENNLETGSVTKRE